MLFLFLFFITPFLPAKQKVIISGVIHPFPFPVCFLLFMGNERGNYSQYNYLTTCVPIQRQSKEEKLIKTSLSIEHDLWMVRYYI